MLSVIYLNVLLLACVHIACDRLRWCSVKLCDSYQNTWQEHLKSDKPQRQIGDSNKHWDRENQTFHTYTYNCKESNRVHLQPLIELRNITKSLVINYIFIYSFIFCWTSLNPVQGAGGGVGVGGCWTPTGIRWKAEIQTWPVLDGRNPSGSRMGGECLRI